MPRRKSSQQHCAVFVAVVVVAGVLLLAYQHGSKKQATIGEEATVSLKRRGDFLRKQMRECSNKTQLSAERVSRLEGATAALWQSNQQLELENERLVNQNNEIEARNTECEEDSRLTRRLREAEEQEHRPRLKELQRKQKELLSKTSAMGQDGMRHTLLTSVLDKLKKEHLKLRKKQALPRAKVDSAYIDQLVQKWWEIDDELTKKGKQGPMSNREGEVLPPNITELSSKSKSVLRVVDRYDPDRHAKAIFLPRKDAQGNYQLPGWNGRQGTQPVRHGTYVNSKLTPVTDINRQMRVLYEYALCAVGNNVTKFMYPTAYKRCADCHTEYLHNFIETPLLLFCDDCRPQHQTNPFKLLCQGVSAENQYGSELFWRARSRLRFRGKFVRMAEEWMETYALGHSGNRIEGVITLAVRIPRGEDAQKRCEAVRQSKRATLSYQTLLKGRAGLVEYSQDTDEQCMPPWSAVYQRVNERVKELQGPDRQVKVYFSGAVSEGEWHDLQKNIGAQIYRRRSTGRPTEDEVVDTMIASHCRYLVLNRFDLKSSHILEAHMLFNKLQVDSPRVW